MNEKIISVFDQLLKKYNSELKGLTKKEDITAHKFKIRAIIKSLKIIKGVDFEIKKGSDLKDIKGIGQKTVAKIDEILNIGNLKTVVEYNKNKLSVMDNELKLQTITGVGPSKSKKLLESGYTLEKLLKLKDNHDELKKILTHHQIIGVKYFHDIQQRIPSLEISKIGIYLKKILKKNSDLDLIICGSYRRKKETSGDIDVLIYNKTEEFSKDNLLSFVDILKQKGFLVAHLTEDGKTKYMGLCKLNKNGIARRIDIRYIKRKHLASSMLYFTGSGEFNKNMRLFAKKKGYKLNEYGLYKIGKDKELKMKTETEQDIFNILGLTYIDPENRTENVIFK